MKPGRVARQEYEYRRHGTLVLFALMIVQTGCILGKLMARRRSPDTARTMDAFLNTLWAQGFTGADVILDNLNTHWSRAMVRVVARHRGVRAPKLRTGTERRAWLESRDHPRVVFHFTPKHASWLNPIEIWFAVLSRKVLRRGSFESTADLQARVERFIEYYNKRLAHPYRFKPYPKHPQKKAA